MPEDITEEIIEKDENKIRINNAIISELRKRIEEDDAQFIGGLIGKNEAEYLVCFSKGIMFISVLFTELLDEVVVLRIKDIK